jgi:hypothetical protein
LALATAGGEAEGDGVGEFSQPLRRSILPAMKATNLEMERTTSLLARGTMVYDFAEAPRLTGAAPEATVKYRF